MNRPLLLVAAASLALTVPAAAQGHDEHLVTGVIEALAAHSQARNIAGLDTLYAPDAWVGIIEGAGVNRGWWTTATITSRPSCGSSRTSGTATTRSSRRYAGLWRGRRSAMS